MPGTIEARLQELGIILPLANVPAGNYMPAVLAGGLLYISGQLPTEEGAMQCTGRLGAEVALGEGEAAARLCGLNIIAQAKAALGDLDRVTRVVKLTGFVACTPDFTDQPRVINGASDLMVAVFGQAGQHARAAVGVAALPLGAAVEVEAVFAVA